MYADIDTLWRQIKRGNHKAWNNLVSRYSGLIITVAKRVGLSIVDAQDCAQHTWMALYRNRNSIREPERLQAWLIITARRQAIRMLKHQHRFDEMTDDVESIESNIPTDYELLRLETIDSIEFALDQLGPQCQKLLRALFLSPEKLSYQEIAQQLKISSNSLGPLRSRCLNKLSKILKKMGYP